MAINEKWAGSSPGKWQGLKGSHTFLLVTECLLEFERKLLQLVCQFGGYALMGIWKGLYIRVNIQRTFAMRDGREHNLENRASWKTLLL